MVIASVVLYRIRVTLAKIVVQIESSNGSSVMKRQSAYNYFIKGRLNILTTVAPHYNLGRSLKSCRCV